MLHSKLSMKNLQTFGQDNPFLRSKSEFQTFRDQNISPQPIHDDKQKRIFQHNKRNEYQMSVMQDLSNQGNASQRRTSSSKQPGKVSQKFQQMSSLPKFKVPSQGNSKNNPYSCNEIIYLLSNQKQCIDHIKNTISNDKQKISSHFAEFKQTVNNIIDDLKLSICASVDSQYQHFVNQFRIVKVEYTNYCNVKRQFWAMRQGIIEKAQKYGDMGSGIRYPGMVKGQGRNQIDNQILLLNMIEDIKDCKKHMNYVQFAQIQQRILKPLLKTVKDMIKQMQIQSYYNPEISHNTFRILQQSIENDVHKLYERMDLFITDHMTDNLNQRNLGKSKKFNNMEVSHVERYGEKENVGLNDWLYQQANTNRKTKQPINYQELNQLKTKRESSPLDLEIELLQIRHPPENLINQIEINQKQTYSSTANTEFTSTQKSKRMSIEKDYIQENPKIASYTNSFAGGSARQTKMTFNGTNKPRKVSNIGKQNCKPNIKLEQCKSIVDKNSKEVIEPQTAICVIYLPLNKIAVGTKSGLIKIFCTKTGCKLTQLHGHHASVCTLTYIPEANLLVSGSDIKCRQLIMWQTQHNTIYHNFGPVHKAAITCTVDLLDNKHILSGSFDNTINIYNYRKKQLIKSINTGQKVSALSRIVDSKGVQLIISGNLNSQICVWKLCRNTFNSVGNLQLVKKINIGTYPYAMIKMQDDELMVAGRDNWLRVININSGSIEIASQIGQYNQLLPIKLKNTPTIYLGFNRNKNICIITPKQQQLTEQILTTSSNCLSFSCAINPKSAVSPQNNLYLVNHTNQQTQIKVWKIVHCGNSSNKSVQCQYLL